MACPSGTSILKERDNTVYINTYQMVLSAKRKIKLANGAGEKFRSGSRKVSVGLTLKMRPE